MERLVGLFDITKKRDVERYCQSLVITSEDFADLILAGLLGSVAQYEYVKHFHEIMPDQLIPKDSELDALANNGVGRIEKPAQKALSKLNQAYIDRRLLAVHLFYVPSQKYWHMFYFDQRDYKATGNHWKHGPHIHYTQDLFTNEPLSTVWAKATKENPEFPPSLHVRYDYHHNRKRER